MSPILRSGKANPQAQAPSKSTGAQEERRRSVRLASKPNISMPDNDDPNPNPNPTPTPTKKMKFGTPAPHPHPTNNAKGKAVVDDEITNHHSDTPTTLFSRQEDKGKGILIMDFDASLDLELKLAVPTSDFNAQLHQPTPELQLNSAPPLNPNNLLPQNQRISYHKQIAKKNASRFARAVSMDPLENDDEPHEPININEDWPGPFSTAINIIRDTQNKATAHAKHFCLHKTGAPTIIWKPNTAQQKHKPRIVPSLQDLSMQVLVNNSTAISSLQFLPDVLVHKLVSMLCDARKMTHHVLDLLFQGSPSEICITDCSWIEEDQFKKSFQPCNTDNIMVLQLDQCGRCMPDYVILETLANKGLPALTTLSLKGACRLSDDGLKAIISSAPALKSLNLSQCSLITDTGVSAASDSLKSGLRELYLDDCQSLNVMLIMPALERLTNLEVLSLVGIPSVCDKFLNQLLGSIGQNMRELVLANCVKLSDSTLSAISKHCFQLCSLNLENVTKLTDSGIGYLASCSQAIHSLKLCRNTFSDEALAAFLEACSESLQELSLNNVREVGPHTSISIARCCKSLVTLDVSWCRNLTDECLGLIADSCDSLRLLKLFGCTQITTTFLAGHSNQDLRIIGINLTPILENLKKRDLLQGPLRYSALLPSD